MDVDEIKLSGSRSATEAGANGDDERTLWSGTTSRFHFAPPQHDIVRFYDGRWPASGIRGTKERRRKGAAGWNLAETDRAWATVVRYNNHAHTRQSPRSPTNYNDYRPENKGAHCSYYSIPSAYIYHRKSKMRWKVLLSSHISKYLMFVCRLKVCLSQICLFLIDNFPFSSPKK